MDQKYTLGIDFGSLSGRAVLVEVGTGNEVASSVKEYTHAVMDEYIPGSSKKLEPDWALQHPNDWLEVLSVTIPDVLNKSGVSPDDVIGVGVDFTACTVLPADSDGVPLCFKEQYKSNPHSYPKLWKHHAAQDEANKLNEIAVQRGERFVDRYGGKQSSEWQVAKVWQVVNEAPEIYDAMDRWIEGADWITWQLTGVEKRQVCTAGYKGIWHKQDGYPSKDFFKALDPRLENYVEEKLSKELYPLGAKAGEITEKAAALTGLKPGTAVCVGNVDAHVSLPAVGITEPGKMLMIIGTSSCDILLGTEEKIVPGMCGVVEDGAMPGYFAYEAGQSCVGDHFDWFVKNCVPASYTKEAEERGIGIHKLLREKASALKAGESGLVALDWWNGNRSVLVDVDLTGMLLGCTLQTKPEEIYRALIEATAYGKRIIIETFIESGVPVTELYACGGIASKDEFMMQIYADVTNMELRIGASAQTPALGAAMFAAVAAGKERGGYDSIEAAAKEMGKVKENFFRPIPKNVAAYDKLYAEYKLLHDYFGRGGNDAMKRLKKIKAEAKREE
ncbi:L-ribulokinase [Anaerobacterium chartisolvens]|uniref:Ribulokinase n=1 Tax=Anaerobacterium chartisolvens TaxID=1297424 RepID=A0A369AYF5_9FIRM|nr:ribulokinase [Anaerobacterium chartisolvens]RCX13217.1 L-ribulokinase [Anaerobacterium chartisolvens]